jgi:hypothetical protein
MGVLVPVATDLGRGLLPIHLAESYNSYAPRVTCAKLYYSTLAQGPLPLHGDLEDIQQPTQIQNEWRAVRVTYHLRLG